MEIDCGLVFGKNLIKNRFQRNAALLNTTGKLGAVGFLSVLIPADYLRTQFLCLYAWLKS